MNGPVLRVAWYRFRATLRRRRSGYVALAVLTGLVGGVALASVVAAHRWLWVLFAHQLSAVPEPAVPVPSIVLVAMATLVLANVIAALPDRWAARTPAATVLRAE